MWWVISPLYSLCGRLRLCMWSAIRDFARCQGRDAPSSAFGPRKYHTYPASKCHIFAMKVFWPEKVPHISSFKMWHFSSSIFFGPKKKYQILRILLCTTLYYHYFTLYLIHLIHTQPQNVTFFCLNVFWPKKVSYIPSLAFLNYAFKLKLTMSEKGPSWRARGEEDKGNLCNCRKKSFLFYFCDLSPQVSSLFAA